MSTLIRCPQCGAKNRIPPDKFHLQPKCGRCGHLFTAAEAAQVIVLDDGSFDAVVNGASLPVMVDFYSPTCGPCQSLAPVIDTLAGQYAGRVVIAKYDTSRHQSAAARFQIRGVPTLIFFKQGRVVDQLVGAAPCQEIEQRLNRLL